MNKIKIPEIVKNTPGSEVWETKIDYSNKDNWFFFGPIEIGLEQGKNAPGQIGSGTENNASGKKADVIYFYPTCYAAHGDAPLIAELDNEKVAKVVAKVASEQVFAFSDCCNIFVPKYRQLDGAYVLGLKPDDRHTLLKYLAAKDLHDALDYYFAHVNNNRPFFFAAHSQGSELLSYVLKFYLKDHPDIMNRMVATYLIGYNLTEQDLVKYPHLKFAEGSDDTGVIVSWTTEGPGNYVATNLHTSDTLCINPLNWKRDETYASKDENLGSLIDGKIVMGLADGQLNLERRVLVCTTADKSFCALAAKLFGGFLGPESFHFQDYIFYFNNIKENVKVRLENYLIHCLDTGIQK